MPIRLYLAPRPGLEPGTYGLTVGSIQQVTNQCNEQRQLNQRLSATGLLCCVVRSGGYLHLSVPPVSHWID